MITLVPNYDENKNADLGKGKEFQSRGGFGKKEGHNFAYDTTVGRVEMLPI